MIYIIENEILRVEISTKGGELQSIKSKNIVDGSSKETEYLWQGDVNYWEDRAPNLFPYIARLTEGKYRYKQCEYEMEIHGFIKDCDMQVEKHTETDLTLYFTGNKVTYQQYPFTFTYFIQYHLEMNKLEIVYKVMNQDNKTMYFAVGGHPGFQVPFGGFGKFEDYYLEFLSECRPLRIGFTEDCFLNGETTNFKLLEDKMLPLYHGLFDSDAIVLKDMSNVVQLKNRNTNQYLEVGFPQMKYLGIWHWPKSKAPYVCIEPWSSLPSRKNKIEELEEQSDLITLSAGNMYENRWWISINI